jgi:hypothetical protein
MAEFGLREPIPPYGTLRPLDSLRIATAIADVDAMKRAVPTGAGVDSAAWADLGRLSWLWQIIGDLQADSDSLWAVAAAQRVSATAARYRRRSHSGAPGPAAEAHVLERVGREELSAIGARRAHIRVFFDSLYAMPEPSP